jgi:hypothetical protein
MDSGHHEDMFNEAAGFIAENYPRAMRLFYNRCVTEGFSSEQTMTLVTKYFEMLIANAVNKDDDMPSDSDSDSDNDYFLGS